MPSDESTTTRCMKDLGTGLILDLFTKKTFEDISPRSTRNCYTYRLHDRLKSGS